MTFIEHRNSRLRVVSGAKSNPRPIGSVRGNVVPFGQKKNANQQTFTIAGTDGVDKPASQKLLIIAVILSAAIHAGVIANLMARDAGEQFGTLADKSNTFSLSIEQSVVLESITNERVQAASAAAAASQAGSVQAIESKPQELAEAETDPLSDEPPPKPIDVAEVTPSALSSTDDPLRVIRGGGDAQAVSEIKTERIAEIEVKEMPEAVETKEDSIAKPERKKHDKKEKKTPQQESHQQVAGSATSRSNASQSTVSGQVSASRGNALSYGAMVRAQLARNKPASNGLRGTVRVSFGVATDGNLSYLRLSESSGSATLDSVALAVVKSSAPFGAPPAGLTASQLSYVIPFYFR